MPGIMRGLGADQVNLPGTDVMQLPGVNPVYEKLCGRREELNYSLLQLKADKEYLEEGLRTGGKGLYIIL